MNWSATSGRLVGLRKHVAAGDVDLVGERQRDRVARFGAVLDLAIADEDGFDRAPSPGSGDHDRVAARHPSARDRAGEAAKIMMRAVDPLHRQAEWGAAAVLLDLDGFEPLQQMPALIPRRPRADRGDIVAEARRDRNREQRAEAKRLGELAIGDDDVAEDALVIVDEIDLVDREHDVAHAEQRHDDRMAVGLREQPLARIDQHDREVGVGRPGRHVAGILLVAGRIGDDERAPGGGEVAIGDVDGDALLALGFEPVDQERVVDVVASRAEFLRVAFERRQLVVEDQLLLVQQSPNQRRLAIVDRPAGEETQGREGRVA